MQIIQKTSEIKEILSDLEKNNLKINLIPTMGNIHEGHLSLLKEANKFEGTNVVSIFINPTQFNDIKDFENYPNTFDQDVKLLSKNNCEIIFAPNINEMYPNGLKAKKTIFEYREILCDAFRPGHFDGVTTVVKILLDIIKPSNVFFGEKDFQQLKIIKKLIFQNKLKA
jgi:Panthothenate synthetase